MPKKQLDMPKKQPIVHEVTCPNCKASLSGPDEAAVDQHLKEHRKAKHSPKWRHKA